MDKAKKQKLKANLRLQRTIIESVILDKSFKINPKEFKKEHSELYQSYNQINNYMEILKKPPTKNFFGIKKKIPLKEIFQLLGDAFKGKMNDHIQDLIGNIESDLEVKNYDPSNAKSPKYLEVKINLVSEVVDKYSGLLEMVLGQKHLDKKQANIVEKSYKMVSKTTERLRRVQLLKDIIGLNSSVNNIIEQKQQSRCSCSKTNSIKKYRTMIDIFNDIRSDPLSSDEMVGGLFVMRRKITDTIASKQRRFNLYRSIDNVLKKNRYQTDNEKIQKLLVSKFKQRANSLEFNWPKPFTFNTLPEVNELTVNQPLINTV